MPQYFFINLIRSIFTYTLWIISVPLFTILALPLAYRSEKVRFDNKLYFYLTGLMSNVIVWATWLDITIIGKENIPTYPDSPCVITCNHTSALDIPLVEEILNYYPHVWISKTMYGKVPLFGRLLKQMHILIKRFNPREAIKALNQGIKRVDGHARHLVIFPEGTRHADEQIHQFQQGFALAAQKLDRPVLPIVIYGLSTVLPKKSWLCWGYKKKILIHVGTPLSIQAGEDRTGFTQRIEKYYKETLADLKKRS